MKKPNKEGTDKCVSIIIRTKDEAKHIGECLKRVFAQDIPFEREVIVIDSGSIDNTLKIARKYPIELIEIPPQSFNYGKALNLGVSRAAGSFVVALSAHALPVDRFWLRRLIEPLSKDVRVAAVFSREVPDKNANVLEKRRLGQMFPDGEGAIDFTLQEVIFSNVSSCIRRSVLEKYPFARLPYSEDIEWARRVTKEGYRIIYEPRSLVVHYHNDSLTQLYRRYYLGGQADYLINRNLEELGPRIVLDILSEAWRDAFYQRGGSKLLLTPLYLLESLVKRTVMCVGFNWGRYAAHRQTVSDIHSKK